MTLSFESVRGALMRFIFLVFVAVTFGLPSNVDAQTKDRLDRRDKLLGWEAVGRLDTGLGHCTAALIERDVVLTAAHCVAKVVNTPGRVTFRAGYSDGGQIAHRQVSDIVIADGYLRAVAQGDRAMSIARDLALLRLESAIFDPGAMPYQVGATPRRGTQLTLASYGRGRLEALTLERGCSLKDRFRGGVVSMDCDATFGSSGAPVFAENGGRYHVVSVVAAGVVEGDDIGLTFGVELSSIVPDMMKELRDKRSLTPISQGARRIGVGERSSGGARFVRPGGS